MSESGPYLNSRSGSARVANQRRGRRSLLKLLGLTVGLIAFFSFLVGSWFYWKLKGSLPVLDGSAAVAGLSAPAKVERDAQGVPTITGQSYLDVARALGFVHGQDRFFEMDVSRRRSAGELSELFGKTTLSLDREARIHDFRPVAVKALAALPADQRAALEAYAAGVNAGLASLKVKPFEYIVLRTKPVVWKPEDSLLVSLTMALTLQDDQGQFLRTLNRVRLVLGEPAANFFSPAVGPADSALDGSVAGLPGIPAARVLDLRKRGGGGDGLAAHGSGAQPARSEIALHHADFAAGSNALAVAGPAGGAIVANDMHLSLGLPNIWYRASLVWPGHKVTGATLPGGPAVIVGSNGHIAWGFTAGRNGTGDLITVNTDLEDFYRGPDADERPITPHASIIHVKGGDDVKTSCDWTVWGPIVDRHEKQLIVYHWSMDDPAAIDFGFLTLYDAATTAQAVAAAHHLGIASENFVVADAAGKIAWTIAGKLPKRVGYSGRWNVYWEYRDRKWDGYLPPEEVPTVTDRPYLWSANQRMLGGDGLAKLGDGGYMRGARGAQIQSDLAALTKAGTPPKPLDLLDIELDDKAEFLVWWRELALKHLPAGEVHDAVANDAEHAAAGSKGYRFVKEFRLRVAAAVLDPIFAGCAEDDANFNWTRLNYEPALRELLTQQPAHLLAPGYSSWDGMITAQLRAQGTSLPTWGDRNRLAIRHPFSRVLPRFLTGWLNLPSVPMPGDTDMPRVQSPGFGASERMAVSPGHEDQGIFEMPGGESGNPLSPYYAAGHQDWVEGKPSPFLPGPTAHTLMLQPE